MVNEQRSFNIKGVWALIIFVCSYEKDSVTPYSVYLIIGQINFYREKANPQW
mgnify:CR=1 FL=1